MSKYKWQFLKHIAGGHSYWLDTLTGKVAIADESGDDGVRRGRPHQTDDGVLWLDMNRSITAAPSTTDRGLWINLPVINEQGEKTTSPIGLDEAAFVAKRFGHLFELEQKRVRVRLQVIRRVKHRA